jgi:hypothetical protein
MVREVLHLNEMSGALHLVKPMLVTWVPFRRCLPLFDLTGASMVDYNSLDG